MSILALMISAVAAKLRSQSADVEITKLKAQIDDLNRQLTEAKRIADRLGQERDALRDTLRRWQHREIHQVVQALQSQQLQSQAQSQLMQQYSLANQGMIGQDFAQTLNDYVCNCVPARHDAFMGIVKAATSHP
jgi:RNAse (barnase) inhibitor barstar